jgi:high-affinity K+ transport system ATPase subunit B
MTQSYRVNDFLAEATPEARLKLIREEQAKGIGGDMRRRY